MQLAFVSRDGVINQRCDGGITHRAQLEFISGSLEAIARLSKLGFTVVMVTHQPGLSRGLFDLDEMEAIHAKISDAVDTRGGEISAIFYCPHDEHDDCYCRPPKTGLLDVIEMEFDCGVDGAWYFCDNVDEQAAAEAKGCQVIMCNQELTLQQAVQSL